MPLSFKPSYENFRKEREDNGKIGYLRCNRYKLLCGVEKNACFKVVKYNGKKSNKKGIGNPRKKNGAGFSVENNHKITRRNICFTKNCIFYNFNIFFAFISSGNLW